MPRRKTDRYRSKKNKRYQISFIKNESAEREKVRARAKEKKMRIKEIKRLMARYESWWLAKWCRPASQAFTGYRLVEIIKVTLSKKTVEIYFEGGTSLLIEAADGKWPKKDELKTLEVTYNEKGNLLPEMQAQNSVDTGETAIRSRGTG